MKKTLLSKTFSAIALVSIVFAMSSFNVAHADRDDNVIGYAFSDMPDGSDQSKPCNGINGSDTNSEHCGRGLGWISLNNINNDGAVGYGVNLNRTTGNFEGHGYATNGGWVVFNPSMTGAPIGPGTTATGARVDPVCLNDVNRTCKVTGWIRFLSATGINSEWDGWVSLSGTGYGLELDKPDTNGVRKFLSGKYAWGASIVGWVDFSYASVIQDMCLDRDGIQTTVPDGYKRDALGNCPPIGDICPTTNYQLPGNPLNGKPDPKTLGYQETLADLPPRYEIRGDMCGVWGCAKTDSSVTINDSSMCDGLPPPPPPPPPIKGCMDPKADNYNELATVADTSCIYTICPNTGLPPVGGVCPGEICGDGIDTDLDGKDPVCPPKGPKQPIYCETGSTNCATDTQPQS